MLYPWYIYPMHLTRLMLIAVAVAVAFCAGAESARAVCTDVPAAEVDWERCKMNKRVFVDQNLRDGKLRGSSFDYGDLSGSDLTGADGRKASFIRAKLVGTVFDEARLLDADFTRADLTGASFRNADLRQARFYRAVLREADFTGARMQATDLYRADLSGAIWIDGERRCNEGSIGQCN